MFNEISFLNFENEKRRAESLRRIKKKYNVKKETYSRFFWSIFLGMSLGWTIAELINYLF